VNCMQRSPTVSVLIPTYNYARYLPQAIESVLNQSFTDFELLISDDGSKDESEEIIRQYAARDDRIRFRIQSPNLGMVNNWNWCLDQATGKYIKYVFGDDFLLHRDAIGQLVRLIESNPNITLASSARTVVDNESNPICVADDFAASGLFDGAAAISWSLRTNCNVFGEPSVVLFRKEAAKRGFDVSYAQVVDWELWIHLLQQGNLAYTSEALTAFRRHDLQQTEVNRRAMGTAHEHPRLIKQYAHYLVLSRDDRTETFERLYRLRRKRRPEPEDLEMANLFRFALGDSYFPCLLRYKVTRPWLNAQRVWRKHVLGKPPPASSFPQPRRIVPIATSVAPSR
jgi:glycosyltransferase involved in cell wall biosynthesis